MKNVVCIDRDGTLIYDDHYYLGKTSEWRDKLRILDGVVEGIKELNRLDDTVVYMITNQSGVAVEDFEKLTEGRAERVCEEVISRLEDKGACLDGYRVCPYVPPEYSEYHPDRSLNEEMVGNFNCIKPSTGMVESILNDLELGKGEANIYVVGDRVSDVKTGLNAGGTGILTLFENRESEKKEVEQLESGKTFIASDLQEAAEYIKSREGVEA